MSETTAYLDRLRSELADVPTDVSREIVAGISEELSGLDADAAAARIRELGDPAFIAAEARAGTTDATPTVRASRGYLIAASLVVAFGGFIVPGLGFIAGLVMVWQSPRWRSWEKWVATLTVPVFAIVVVALVAAAQVVPGIPTHSSILVLLVVVPVATGLWLLLRGLQRTPAA